MADKTILNKELLNNLFNYVDGDLYWKKRNGKRAGTKTNRYIQTAVNKKLHGNHRLIFLMFHGYMPECVDHIDGNTFNNRIENLRAATFSENIRNSKISTKNTTGVKGVTKFGSKFRASISLGVFNDLESAKQAVMEARSRYHGEFANHGCA